MTDTSPILIRISRSWDEPAWRTESFRPAGAVAVLLRWTIEPAPVDAGVPDTVMDTIATVATSLGLVAFRLFVPEDVPSGLTRIAPEREWLPKRLFRRLTRTWSAEIGIAATAKDAAGLFLQDWSLQGQAALVLRNDLPSEITLEQLRRARDWRDRAFPADARLMIAPAVDGDGVLLAAAQADELGDMLITLGQALERASIPIKREVIVEDFPGMQVAVSHHVDASEPDEKGFYEYYYEYDIYEFSQAGRTYTARSYVDETDKAAFLSCREGERSRLLNPTDLIHPLLVEAADYLHVAGKTTLDRLSENEGYVRLEVLPISLWS